MYPAIKSNAINETEARKIVGDANVDAVLALNCEPTSRVIDDVYEVVEMSASINCQDQEGNDVTLVVLYLVDADGFSETEDLGNLDYSRYTFEIL